MLRKKDKIYQGIDAFIELWSEIPKISFFGFFGKKTNNLSN